MTQHTSRFLRSPTLRELPLSILCGIVAILGCFGAARASAGLPEYDAAIASSSIAGLIPAAQLTNAAQFFDTTRLPFNFGTTSGDATFEFVLEGDPVAGGPNGYLAVGANSSSNLRYEQWNDTGQLGFTQLGVADYLFSPVVPSPVQPTHVAFVWDSAGRAMTIYLGGSVAGTRSGVDGAFAMPSGQGWLGNSAAGNEGMVGTIYRVTIYNTRIPEADIQQHSDAFHDVVRPPLLLDFTATPPAVFTPASTVLSWNVLNAAGVSIDGNDVTGQSQLTVTPFATHTYTLVATNSAAAITGSVMVAVNPAPVIERFAPGRSIINPGDSITLEWTVRYGDDFGISPQIGDVTLQTANGVGSISLQPTETSSYTLRAGSPFGSDVRTVTVTVVPRANHLIISEFLADNEGPWRDEDGAFSDWIEIQNPTSAEVDLGGYFLTDNKADLTQWPFPNVNIQPGAYLVVWASGKNRRDPQSSLHTNFELNKTGEYLALVGPGPRVIHAFSPAYPPQSPGVAYGTLAGSDQMVRALGAPTPGEANDETLPPPAPVEFSQASGFITNAFLLSLKSATIDAVIRYTLDGASPSATQGLVYAGPISIETTRRVRAISVIDSKVSEVRGESYVKLGPDLLGYTSSLPILVIENFAAGIIPQKGWSGTGAAIKQVPRQTAIWATFDRHAGVSALGQSPEMFSTIGIRGRGAFSSTWRQKPYSVEAIREDGGDLKVSPLGMPAHAEWVLYFPDPDSNKDPALLFNTFVYDLNRALGNYSVRFRWVEAFVNEDGGDLTLTDRRGVYAIVEKVSRGADRLDFEPLSTDGTSGSWLLNLNRMDPEPENGWPAPNGATQPWFFHTAGPNRILQTPPNASVVGDDEPQQSNGYLNFESPNGYTINTNQRAAIENWFKQFEDVLWNNALWRDPANGYRRYLDPVDFADYFVLNTLTKNGDGLLISMFPWKGNDGKLRMGPPWDYNWSAYYISGGPTGALLHRPERLWYRRLFADPDFAQLYIDRWWDHRRGAMSNSGIEANIDQQVADITPEKAVLNGFASSAEWLQQVSQFKTWLTNRANWIDGNYLRPPNFNQEGGPVADGFQLIIYGTNGTIYYSVDGSDPRAPGGGVMDSAVAYQAPVLIDLQTLVQARIRNGTNWSGLTRAVFYPPQDLSALEITEIQYHPAAVNDTEGDELEFIELHNAGVSSLALGTLRFTSGISFTFTNGSWIEPGQFIVLAGNPSAFSAVYPAVSIFGVYSGHLDNGGETLRLSTPANVTVLAVTYADRAPWPLAADGYGFSLIPRETVTHRNSDDGADWRASSQRGGSPGQADPEPPGFKVVINEVLTHTDLPVVDQVELFNPGAEAIDIGGWFLTDDGASPRKYRIPDATIISAGGYRTFTEMDFNPEPPIPPGINFSLDSAGDAIYLSAGDSSTNLSGYTHGFSFGAAAAGVSFGRYVNSIGEEQFPAQMAVTLGAANSGPRVGPIVFTEIHYHPEIAEDEFLELQNITDQAVPLFDSQHPTNTWRINGLGYAFPPGATLAPNAILLVVRSEPSIFRMRHAVGDDVPIFGPFSGQLQDSGERLEIQRPELQGTNGVAFIAIDSVRYNDRAPWPPASDGSGPSLQRRVASAYGDDPANWEAAIPTPGRSFVPGSPPAILTSPEDLVAIASQDVQLSVSAVGGAPLFYQWLFNDSPILGATNSALMISEVQLPQAGSYRVIVYNAAGSIASRVASLRLRLPAVILQPPQDRVAAAGTAALFSVSAIGVGTLRYQWEFNGAELAGETNATLTINNTQAGDEGTYRVIVTDDVGPARSRPATLTVLFRPTFLQQPEPVIAVAGDTVRFTAMVSGTAPFGFRWRRSGNTVTNIFMPGGLSTFTIRNVRTNDLGNYTVVVTNRASPAGILSSNAPLTVLNDADGDHIPDEWETAAHGLDPSNSNDGALDFDGDGLTNLEEYIAGTDPRDPASYLKVNRFQWLPGRVALEFLAVSNKTYSVLVNDEQPFAEWRPLTRISARTTNHLEIIEDAELKTKRFYRLVTPAP